MRAWIAARFWGAGSADAGVDQPLIDGAGKARSLIYLYASGGVVGLLTLILPHSARFSATPVLALVAAAAVAVAVLLARFDDMGSAGINILVAYATIAITAANLFSNTQAAEYNSFFFWIVLYAAVYLSLPAMMFQVALVLVGVSLSLWRADVGADRVGRWLTTASALVLTSLVVWVLRRRVDFLIARLARAAHTDALTGLWNRRHFDRMLRTELARAQRAGSTLALVIGDLDGFKAVNDRQGHASGDLMLATTADVLTASVREVDYACRIGGEEFALVLPATDGDGAEAVAQRARLLIERSTYCTISFGIAVGPDDGETPAALLRAADRAMYTAKARGKNQVARRSAGVLPGHDRLGSRDRAALLDRVEASASLSELAATARDATGAMACAVLMTDAQRRNLVVVASIGYPEEVIDSLQPFQVDAALPAAEAWRTGELILIDSPIQLGARFPLLASLPVTSAEAWAMVPFAPYTHRCVIDLGYAKKTAFLADDQAFLTELGDRAARVLARVPVALPPSGSSSPAMHHHTTSTESRRAERI